MKVDVGGERDEANFEEFGVGVFRQVTRYLNQGKVRAIQLWGPAGLIGGLVSAERLGTSTFGRRQPTDENVLLAEIDSAKRRSVLFLARR